MNLIASGVFRVGKNDLRIDINNISELRNIEKTKQSLTLGGSVSLTLAMETFRKYSSEAGFKYLRHLAHHIDLIASVPVRNIGTLAGNLMIKHTHHEFPSDLFLMLETAGSQVHILEGPGRKQSMMLRDFLKTNMRHKIIYSIMLPALSDEYEYRSYKIMPRAQNAHAHVNAGFLFKLDGGGKVMKTIYSNYFVIDCSLNVHNTFRKGAGKAQHHLWRYQRAFPARKEDRRIISGKINLRQAGAEDRLGNAT